ncbi:hypothetical protein JR316_0011713 [Psilocybe cubensis]|nr:hypothetical protein JR316_0011713 [Psilocybe cubensis]KAH9476142.1 hypothetical protein JR316_0011713 [Psilocybe cubensis]
MSFDTLHWSSPTRKNNNEILSPIPNEIYLEILSYVRDSSFASRTLLKLVRVCRFFGVIVIPWLFERVVVKPSGENDAYSPQNCAEFCRSIHNGDEHAKTLAQYVKTCVMVNWDTRKEDTGRWIAPLFALYTKSIQTMTNIQELDICLTHITKHVLKAMSCLPRLESLKLTECSLDPHVDIKHLAKLSSLKLKKISFIGIPPMAQELLDDFASIGILGSNPESVHPLLDHLNWEYITDLNTTNWYLVDLLSAVKGDLRLESMSLYPYFMEDNLDLGALVSILVRAPALRDLRIVDPPSNFSTTLPEPLHLPALNILEAPPTLMASIVPGKPVEAVELHDKTLSKHPDYILDALALSSKPIVKVRTTPEFYKAVPFWKYFPNLTTLGLTIELSHPSLNSLEKVSCLFSELGYTSDVHVQALSDTLCAWPRHPGVRSFHTRANMGDDSDAFLDLIRQNAWIKDIIFPQISSLRNCQFFYCLSWFYVEEDDHWKPEIIPSHAQEVVGRLLVAEYKDYDNCFETLLLHSKG